MTVKKLVVEERTFEDEETYTYYPGETYSYFVDPETGKFYRPKEGFEVTGEDLEDHFVEVVEEVVEVDA